MLHSILMMSSSYNYENKIIKRISILSWVIYMLVVSIAKSNMIFIIGNIIAFSLAVLLSLFIKNKIANGLCAIASVLIWSITIDIICYFMYTSFTFGQSLIKYILNGIIFNYRYVLYNVIVFMTVKIIGPEFLSIISKVLLTQNRNKC